MLGAKLTRLLKDSFFGTTFSELRGRRVMENAVERQGKSVPLRIS
jgi:hypothetical protein